ncbi:hypothetical protein D3C76_233240 [compost metagenome]
MYVGKHLRGVGLAVGHHVGDDTGRAAGAVDNGHGVVHTGLALEGVGDFTQFDAVTANLHLMVDPPQVIDLAVRQLPRQIAGSVHAATGGPERVGHEAFGGHRRAAVIASRHPCAGKIQLALAAGAQRLQRSVQHISLHVGQRPPKRRTSRRRWRLDRISERAHGGFGWAVMVEQRAVRGQLRQLCHQPGGASLAAQHQRTLRQCPGRVRAIEQSLQVGRDNFQHVHGVCVHVGGETLGVQADVQGNHMQAAAAAQCAEQGGMAKVGRQRGNHRHARDPAQRQALQGRLHVVGQGAMADGDTLRTPGRARGIDDIGQVIGIQLCRRSRRTEARQFLCCLVEHQVAHLCVLR